ncbi:thioredoxin family protein [Paraburkholderia sp. SIMBA_055]|uniref:thioredoxin family protein n=1 Tax=Paraburkholderia sp. SIMBA_054 TaxID=3085795 RepID=UPI00397DB26B
MKPFSLYIVGVLFAVLSSAAIAGGIPFEKKTFDELRTAGRPVVVHVYAKWCETCQKQATITPSLLAAPEFKELTLMEADFDKEKALLKELHVPYQSTFVAFKGTAEVGRSTGETNKERIAALFRKAL